MTTDSARIGLCFTCRNAQRVPSRTTSYWLCRLAATDPRFEKYPRLPVLHCDGYAPGDPDRAPRPQGPEPAAEPDPELGTEPSADPGAEPDAEG